VGYANEEKMVYRNGAKVGDLIAVSGDLGAAYFRLAIIRTRKTDFPRRSKYYTRFRKREVFS
jgi:thiamine-monophosphate kinase